MAEHSHTALARSSFPEWLYALSSERETGVLVVTAEGLCTEIQFLDGAPVFAMGGNLGTTLGRILVRHGALTTEQYDGVMEELARAQRRPSLFGQHAVSVGILSPAALEDALQDQVRAKLLGCMEWTAPVCRFEPGSTRLATHGIYPVAVEPLILRGIKAYYDPARFSPLLEPGWRLFPVCTEPAAELARWLEMSAEEEAYLSRMDGTARTDELVTHSGLDTVHAGQLMAALTLTRSVEFRPTRGLTTAEKRRAAAVRVAGARALRRPGSPAAGPSPGAPPPGAVKGAAAPVAPPKPAVALPASQAADATRRRQTAAEVCFQRGKRALASGHHAAARTEFAEARRLMPEVTEYQLLEAWTELVSEKHQTGTQELRERLEKLSIRALRQDRSLAFAHFVQGHLAMMDGDDVGALRAVRVAAKLDPTLADAKRYEQLISRRLKR